MKETPDISPAELLRKVRLLDIATRKKTKHVFSGGYHSSFKGMGITFSEVRPYQFGDDIRSIDWSVTAKTGSPHIKLFEEERELSVLIIVDISHSTLFGTHQTINAQITELCASLAVTAHNNGDKVGLLLFSGQVESFIPPKKGKGQVLRILRELVLLKGQAVKTSISTPLDFLLKVLKKHHLVFLISDFLDTGYVKPLSLLSQKHELIGIRIWDNFYDHIPTTGFMETIDPETGEKRILDLDGGDRDALEQQFKNYGAYFQDAFIRAAADQVTIKTTESIYRSLLKFFELRKGISR